MYWRNGTTSTSQCHRKVYIDWLNADGTARASIRAMSDCRLATGLSSQSEIVEFRKQHREEIQKLVPQTTEADHRNSERAWRHLRGAVQTSSALNAQRRRSVVMLSRANTHPGTNGIA